MTNRYHTRYPMTSRKLLYYFRFLLQRKIQAIIELERQDNNEETSLL